MILKFLKKIGNGILWIYRRMDYWVTYVFVLEPKVLREYTINVLVTSLIISILIYLQPVLFWLLCIAFLLSTFFLIWFVSTMIFAPLCKKFDRKNYDKLKERVEIISKDGYDAYYNNKN